MIWTLASWLTNYTEAWRPVTSQLTFLWIAKSKDEEGTEGPKDDAGENEEPENDEEEADDLAGQVGGEGDKEDNEFGDEENVDAVIDDMWFQ